MQAWQAQRLRAFCRLHSTWMSAALAVIAASAILWWLAAAIRVAGGHSTGLESSLCVVALALSPFLRPLVTFFVQAYFLEFLPSYVFTRPMQSIFDASVAVRRAWPWLCDPNMHMTNQKYSAICDEQFFRLLNRMGYLTVFMGGVTPVVGTQIQRYRRELPIMSAVKVETRLQGWDDRYMYIEFLFKRGGRTAVVCLRKVMMVNNRAKTKGERQLAPAAFLTMLADTYTFDPSTRASMLAAIGEGRAPSQAMTTLLAASDSLLSPD